MDQLLQPAFPVSFQKNKQSKRFIIGTFLIVAFSLFCGYLNIGLFFLFGIPLVPIFIGVLLVWISSRPWTHRLFATFLIFPSFVAGFAFLYVTLPRAEPETFLIPADFRGTFLIDFVEACSAEPILYENGRRIYRIPKNGVLIQQGKRSEGLIDRRFFLVDDDGKLTELPEFSYHNYQDERNSWRRWFGDEIAEESLGAFWAYFSKEAFIILTFREMASRSQEQREVENSRLFKLHEVEMKRLNCKEAVIR